VVEVEEFTQATDCAPMIERRGDEAPRLDEDVRRRRLRHVASIVEIGGMRLAADTDVRPAVVVVSELRNAGAKVRGADRNNQSTTARAPMFALVLSHPRADADVVAKTDARVVPCDETRNALPTVLRLDLDGLVTAAFAHVPTCLTVEPRAYVPLPIPLKP
jgi:hypothetical protein